MPWTYSYQINQCSRGIVLKGKSECYIKQSTIYTKFGKSSRQIAFKKQKIIPWLTEHDDVINITSLPAPGGGRLYSYATDQQSSKTEQFITAKISDNALKQGSRTDSMLRQRTSQVQKYKAARISRGIAVDQKVCGWDVGHPGLTI